MTVTAAPRPLVFATRNPGKLVELRALLPGIDVIDLADLVVIARRDDDLSGCGEQ